MLDNYNMNWEPQFYSDFALELVERKLLPPIIATASAQVALPFSKRDQFRVGKKQPLRNLEQPWGEKHGCFQAQGFINIVK